MSKPLCFFAVALTLVATFVWSPRDARAGDREIEAMMVRVDDDSDPEARRCYGRLRRPLAADYSRMASIPRDVLMRRIDEPSMDGFASWPRERFRGATGRRTLDALILVDCRPTEHRVDIVVFAGTSAAIIDAGHLARIQLRDVTLDTRLQRTLGERIQRVAWTGFSP